MSVKKELTNRKIYMMFEKGTLEDNFEVILDGWIRGHRSNKEVGFIEFNDGSYFKPIQIVYDNKLENFDEVTHFRYQSSISIKGKIVLTPNMKQPFEIHAISISLLGDCVEDYPLQKKRHSFEFLREIAYLRPRANTFSAVFRVRNALSYAVHSYFQDRGFMYVHTPEITGNDAEGAGQSFKVVTDLKNPTDFFNANASLTVSGQLHVEAFAMAFGDVYTFGPTFRAEKSNTSRHASEFWMIEPEIAFADLEDDMDLMEDCLKYLIKYILENCKDEMNFFNTLIEQGVIDKLKAVINSEFKRMTYTEAIEILLKAKNDGHKFEYSDIAWGMDLQSEHERYLTEQVVKGPLFLIDYPEEIKAFYMKLNDDGRTVAACDLLVPGVGELMGGSQREDDYEILRNKMIKQGNEKELEWYLNLRKYGGCKHAGFGIGFDRLLMYITGIQNIRDVEPYPRNSGSLKY